ncbi:unnamed protein product [marine sediment metagenome]|uniref:Uncharacterized protein n=1 Tax=marine sediment metagenome TaxID=412755 RepID=X1HJU7_9ZZZZ
MVKTGRKTQQQRKEESLGILCQNEVFATPEDTERIYRYQEGKYVLGKTMINATIEEHHGDKCSTALCRAVTG